MALTSPPEVNPLGWMRMSAPWSHEDESELKPKTELELALAAEACGRGSWGTKGWGGDAFGDDGGGVLEDERRRRTGGGGRADEEGAGFDAGEALGVEQVEGFGEGVETDVLMKCEAAAGAEIDAAAHGQ